MQASNNLSNEDIDRKIIQWVNGSVDEYLENKQQDKIETLKKFSLDSNPEKKEYEEIGVVYRLQSIFIRPSSTFFQNKVKSIYDTEIIYVARMRLYQKIVAAMKDDNQNDAAWQLRIKEKLAVEYKDLKNRNRPSALDYFTSISNMALPVLFLFTLFNTLSRSNKEDSSPYLILLISYLVLNRVIKNRHRFWPKPQTIYPLVTNPPKFEEDVLLPRPK